MPHSVLSNMQGLIEEGQLSREDVIEHLINNGFLPVEVTELGRLPITVGLPDIRGDYNLVSISSWHLDYDIHNLIFLNKEAGRQQR